MLTKSDLLSFIQCRKKLWLEKHRPDLNPPSDQGAQRRAADGNLVGETARELLGEDRIWPKTGDDKPVAADRAWSEIRAARGKPAVEVPMVNGQLYARADAVLPAPRGYVLRETKASTFPLKGDKVTAGKPEPHHVDDVAIQAWAFKGSGEKLARSELNLLNNRWRYPGRGDYSGLFRQLDVTSEVNQRVRDVPKILKAAVSTLAGKMPKISTGPHCDKPYECPFKESCSASEPPGPEHPIELLPDLAGKNLAAKLKAQKGYESLLDPKPSELTGTQSALYRRMQRAHRTGKGILEPEAAGVLGALPYPRFYFDFEAIDLPVPRWIGTRPYEHVPFQWSCHIERKPGVLEHASFLDLSGNDPSIECIGRMRDALGKGSGPVIVYHATYEKLRLKEYAERHPAFADLMNSYIDRLFDLRPLVRANFYHPDMRGSFSIKAVLPVVAPDLDYEALGDVSGGTEAQVAWLRATSPECGARELEQIRASLLRYCAQDTWAMVEVAYFLAGKPRPVRPD
jgi:CRISPR/Cas system-associated exonuclease Cas4 (RecB family)